MKDSEIKREIILDFNNHLATFKMVVPIDGLRATQESWDLFGKVAKDDMQMVDILLTMAEMIRAAKR